MKKIIRNMLQCKHCGDIIESKSVHHFVWCSCHSCATDGGTYYLHRTFKNSPKEDFIDLTEYGEEEDE